MGNRFEGSAAVGVEKTTLTLRIQFDQHWGDKFLESSEEAHLMRFLIVSTCVLFFVSLGFGESPSIAERKSLKVLSNNVGIFPQQIVALYPAKLKEKKKHVLVDETEKATRLAQALTSFDGDPDVLLLQEIWSIPARDRLIGELSKKFPYCKYPMAEKASIAPLHLSGLIVLSKYELNDFEFKEFTKGFGTDKLARKGIVGVRLIKDGKSFSVFTTHLQAGAKNDPAVKLDQLRECNEFMHEFVGDRKGETIIIAGDFNIRSTDQKAYDTIFSQLPGAHDSYKEQLGLPTTTTRNEDQPTKRIDYLLTFGEVKAESIIVDPAGPEVSDHRAILGTIKIE